MTSWPDRPARLEFTVEAVTSALGGVRLQLAVDAADSGVDLDAVEELVVVVSELVSNVIRHTDDRDVTIRFDSARGEWTLDVSGADSMAELPDAGSMPDPLQQGGRGLVIVRAMTDAVGLVDVDGRRWVRCSRRS